MAESLLQPVKKLNRRGLRQRMHYRYYVLEDYEAVVQHHNTMILTNQRNSEFACHCALAHAQLGRIDEALAVLEHLTEKGEANACFTAFDILRREGRKAEALAMVNRSMKQYGISPISKTWAAADFDLLHLEAEPVEPHHDERLVTVIMTAHKDNPMMNKAVTSILQQSYVNLELLIIDDASAKEDVAVYEAFEASDERIQSWFPANEREFWNIRRQKLRFETCEGRVHCSPSWIQTTGNTLRRLRRLLVGWIKTRMLLRASNRTFASCLTVNWHKLDHGLFENASWGRFGRGNLCWKRLADLTRFACPLIRNCWNGRSSSSEKNASFTQRCSYIATYHRQSLTGGGPFSIGWRGVRGARHQYVANFRAWHARNQNNVERLAHPN